MTFRTTLTTWTLVVACLGGFGCLRGSQSDPCEILKDCLCGELASSPHRQSLRISQGSDWLPRRQPNPPRHATTRVQVVRVVRKVIRRRSSR